MSNVSLSSFAKELGVNKGTLYRKAQELGINTRSGLSPSDQETLMDLFGKKEQATVDIVLYPKKHIGVAAYQANVIQNGLTVDMLSLEALEGALDEEYDEIQTETLLEMTEIQLLEAKVRAIKAKKERNDEAKRKRELESLENRLRAEILGKSIGADG